MHSFCTVASLVVRIAFVNFETSTEKIILMKQAFMMLVVLLCSISGWSQKRIFSLYNSQVEKLMALR